MRRNAGLFNVLTVLVLALTLLVCLCAGITFVNPQVFFNPLKPPNADLPALLSTSPPPAPTNIPVKSPTLPPVSTATPAATSTAAPTSTSLVDATITVGPTSTETPFPTPVGPTTTLTPTDLPSRTPTLKPPRSTATRGFYPPIITDTPGPATSTPVGYP